MWVTRGHGPVHSLGSPVSVGAPQPPPCSSPRPLPIPHTLFSWPSGATRLGFQARGVKLVHPWLLDCFGGKLHLRMLKTTSIVPPKAPDLDFFLCQLNFVSTSHPVHGGAFFRFSSSPEPLYRGCSMNSEHVPESGSRHSGLYEMPLFPKSS